MNRLEQTISELKNKGVSLAAMETFLLKLGTIQNIDESQVPDFLVRFGDDYIKLDAQLARHRQSIPNIQTLRDTAQAKILAGDLDGARKELSKARFAQQEELNENSREEALLLTEMAEIEILDLNFSAAAEIYAEAAKLVKFDLALKAHYLMQQTNCLYELGQQFDNNVALESAVDVLRNNLIPLYSDSEDSKNLAACQNYLGTLLLTLGDRDSGVRRIEESIEAYKQALIGPVHIKNSLEVAITHNNLGNAFHSLGRRVSDTEHFENAIIAYQRALSLQERERAPLNWAMTQNNLGNALLALGERESGIARLEDAVQAFEQALLEWTRERVPLDWAMTQSNLGTAFAALGERESGIARLEDAVQAYEHALLERTRERVPMDWAMTQNNLGNALQALGEREGGTKRLEQAAHAFDLALSVFEAAGADYYVQIARKNLSKVQALIKARQKA